MYIYIQICILLTAIINLTLQKWQNRNLYTPESFPDIRYAKTGRGNAWYI